MIFVSFELWKDTITRKAIHRQATFSDRLGFGLKTRAIGTSNGK
jgi:hypothetical protein